MTFFQRLTAFWREDLLLRSVVRNTSYLFSSNTVSMGLTFLQGLMAAALLGARSYGALGMIIAFASNVNRLLSFRMNELVVRYGGHFLADGEKTKAAAVVKVAGIAEAITSFIAYGILLLLARWGATVIIKDPSTIPWIGATIGSECNQLHRFPTHVGSRRGWQSGSCSILFQTSLRNHTFKWCSRFNCHQHPSAR